MSYLMFAARKLQLIREMNSKNYELTLIMEQHKDATRKVADFQEAQNAAKNQVNVWTAQYQGMGQRAAVAQLQSQYDLNNMDQQQRATLWNEAIRQGTLAGNQLAASVSSITENIMSAQNKAQLAKLNAQANTLELRQQHLQSELKVLEQEKGNLDKAEAEAVKTITPQFGLA